jgi:DNA repair exonuclease SbcCD ATPase subunit
MDAVKLPNTLEWNTQKAAFAKVKSPPPLKEPLDKVGKAHEAIDWTAFGADKLKTPADATKRLADLEREAKGSLKVLSDKAAEAESAAKKAVEPLKKDKTAGDAAKAAEAIMKAAAQLQTDVTKFITAARSEVQTELERLEKEAKKGAPAAGGKPVLTKESKFIRGKIIECFRKIKTPAPGAKPWRFLIAKGPQNVAICLLQTPPGNAHFNMLKKMLPGEKLQLLKDPKGEVLWEKKSLTLVTVQPASGVAKKLQLWLKKVTGLNVKIRVRKPTGEVEDEDKDFQGEDLPDDQLKADPEEEKARAEAGAQFKDRLTHLWPQIQSALAANLPADVKKELSDLVASVRENGKERHYEDANDDLDSLEALLEDDAVKSAVAGTAPGGGPSLKQLAEARLRWIQERDRATREIKRLAEAIAREFAADKDQLPQARKAIKDLYDLADKELKVGLEARIDDAIGAKDGAARVKAVEGLRATLADLRGVLDKNPVLRELDGNEVLPDMKVVAPIKERLDAVEAALG